MEVKSRRFIFARLTIGVLSCVVMFALVSFGISLYQYIFIFQPFRVEADYFWVHDGIAFYISDMGRMPESWEELLNHSKAHGTMLPIDGIRSRVEINFELMKNINVDKLPPSSYENASGWVYRFYDFPNAVDQRKVMKHYHKLLSITVPVQGCPSSTSVGGAKNAGSDIETESEK